MTTIILLRSKAVVSPVVPYRGGQLPADNNQESDSSSSPLPTSRGKFSVIFFLLVFHKRERGEMVAGLFEMGG